MASIATGDKILTMAPEITPPVLLLATPQVLDPFFYKSVVLLLQHGDEGSLGLIINRTTGLKVAEILEGLEIAWGGEESAPAFFGGPVQPQLGTVLFRDGEVAALDLESGTATELLPGFSMTQHVGNLTQLAASPPGFFRLVLGYSGWGEGQLVEELTRNDWLVAEPTDSLLFDLPPETVWASALESLGIDPDTLAAWATDEEGSVN